LLVIIIISPTLHHLYESFGWEGLRFYFIDNNIGRITGEVAGSNTDPLFYFYNLVWAFLPWTILLVVGIFLEIKSWTGTRSRDALRAAIPGSVFVLLVILSIARGKAPNYMMVMTAPLSVVIAGWSDYWLKLPGEKIRKLIVSQALLLTAIFLFLLFAVFFFAENVYWLTILLIILSGVALYAVYRLQDNSAVRIILASLIVTGTFNLFLNSVIIPQLFSYQGCRKVLTVFEENRKNGDRLYNFEVEQYELFFYSEDKVTDIDNWEDLYKTLESPGSWIYTNRIKYNDIMNMKYPVDTVYQIRQRGMNRITLEFLNPQTREESLITNYLIKTGE
jgi:4-amino-4-deoxy-L-arabinose transferase-like glycosyltransferase